LQGGDDLGFAPVHAEADVCTTSTSSYLSHITAQKITLGVHERKDVASGRCSSPHVQGGTDAVGEELLIHRHTIARDQADV